ncbi:MAG: LPS export ABC transporter permease LptF [Nevskiales bacterium]|nr:LPS export ABC transporter permease LptF [Nevskiales bacterium]
MLRQTRLDRYLLREGMTAWLAVTLVLLGIMLTTRFARFLAQAAAGELPREFLLKVVALSSLQYLVILIPVSLLLAILLSLGRMYRDQEIAAMTGCGLGPLALYRPFLLLAVSLTALTAALSFQIGPWAGRQADRLMNEAQQLIQFTPFEPGRFKSVAGGRAVFYTARMNESGDRLDTVFAVLHEGRWPSVITARHGVQGFEARTGERFVRLEQGYRYTGTPGRTDYDILSFDTFTTRVSPSPMAYLSGKRKLQETGSLIGSEDPEDQAELQWRIAAPVSVLLLALLAVPLAHTSPREGRYGKLVLGLLAYLIYTNLITLGQAWVAKAYLPPMLGVWWVHGLAAVGALTLIAYRLGWFLQVRFSLPSGGKKQGSAPGP